jgi:HPt (histidine-containing phosphotransfer) domain-containing protein
VIKLDINREEYVDEKSALHRIGGSKDLYKRLLGQFNNSDHITPIEEAFGKGATEEASRMLHALKGTSANLSLVKLSAIAAELEHKVKNGTDHSESLVELKNVYDITSQLIVEML